MPRKYPYACVNHARHGSRQGGRGARVRTIASERLRLVPVRRENAAALWRILQEPALREYQDLPDVDLEQFERMVAARPRELRANAYGRFEWLIYLAGVAEPVGWASLRLAERSAGSGEIGYSVVPGYQGRGIATEAVRALVNEAFARANLRRVRAYCLPENRASRAVLQNAGFTEDGLLAHGATIQGRTVDVLGFVLERSAIRQASEW
jgi:RimJ/RimL family protein N-acetyltransferase